MRCVPGFKKNIGYKPKVDRYTNWKPRVLKKRYQPKKIKVPKHSKDNKNTDLIEIVQAKCCCLNPIPLVVSRLKSVHYQPTFDPEK